MEEKNNTPRHEENNGNEYSNLESIKSTLKHNYKNLD